MSSGFFLEEEEFFPPNLTYAYDDMDLPPLRIDASTLHDLRRSARSLSHIVSDLPKKKQHKRGSLDSKAGFTAGDGPSRFIRSRSLNSRNLNRSSSRSKSPSVRDFREKSGSLSDGASISSLEDLVDLDILYDKMGLEELDPVEQKNLQNSLQNSHSNLTPVSERLCDDTLDDVHAFSDVTVSTTRASSSVGGSTVASIGGSTACGGSCFLAPLNECEDEDEDYLSDNENQKESESGQVILTNMEKISIFKGGPSRQQGETPSLRINGETPTVSIA